MNTHFHTLDFEERCFHRAGLFGLVWRSCCLALLIFLQFNSVVHAQNTRQSRFYGNAGFNLGAFKGYSLQLNYVNEKQYAISCGITRASRADGVPSDYDNGLTLPFDLDWLGMDNRPFQYHSHIHLLAGKAIYLTNSGFVRLNLLSGVSLGVFRDVENMTYQNNAYLFAPNYSYDFVYRLRPSIMLQPTFEFALFDLFGISFSPMAQLNTHQSYYGFMVGFVTGDLRRIKSTTK